VLLYRVFPYVRSAAEGQPGPPLYIRPDPGTGRWDNPDLYLAFYAAPTATAAVGESFAHLSTWTRAMLAFPSMAGAVRALGVYTIEEELHPVLDLDDAKALLDRGLRPTEVVVRNRPRTQQIARDVFHEKKPYCGLGWWSMHRPQWALLAYWHVETIGFDRVEALPGHPALLDAAGLLGKDVAADLRRP